MIRHRRLGLLTACALLAAPVFVAVTPGAPAAAAAIIYNGAGSAPRIGIIGDSAFAGIRVVNTFDPLKQFNFVYDAETCRRTVLASCSVGQGAPPNAITTLRQRAGQWGSVLVMATGYNDPGHNFDDAVDAVMAEAARQGIPTVMWLTFRTAPVSFVPPDYRSTSTTFRDNNLILLQKAQQYAGRLQIADWAGFTASHNEWFSSDGIHFRTSGALAAAQYIASQARRVLNGESITPTRGGVAPPGSLWTFLRYGMGGTVVADLQRLLIAEGITVRGGIDGVFSIWTVYAVQTFQRLHALHPNGIVDETTARKLGLLSGPWTAIGVGATGTSVTRVQQALIARGIAVRGGATGEFTIWTYYAVQTYQRRQGLRVSGVVDGATARALGLITAPEPSAVWTPLSKGSTGTNVARAQQALIDNGVHVAGGPTGTFTIATYYAVNTFQRHNGLRVSGVIDVETAQALGLFDLSNPVATWTNLALGSAGPAVADAERALAARGVRVRDGVDTVFKLGDYYAVQTFQRYNGLPVTGVINLATANRLGMFSQPATASVLVASAPMTTPTTTTTTTTTSTTTTTTPTTTTTSTTTPTTPTTTAATTTAVPAGLSISGRAWVDVNGDGDHDLTEPGLAGVSVRLDDGGGAELASDVTGDDGAFEFVELLPGTYVLDANVPEGYAVTAADQIATDLGSGDPDDADSDFVAVDVATGTTRTAWISLTAAPIDDIGLGLVPVPTAVTTTTSTAVTSSTVIASTSDPVPTELPTSAAPSTADGASPTEPATTTATEPASTTAPPTSNAPSTSLG